MFATKSNLLVLAMSFGSCFINFTHSTSGCDLKTCTGPLYYYQELGCIPIYGHSSSCCPKSYNCDHWKHLPDNKCFVNGRVYENGEAIPIGEIGDACVRCSCVGGNSYPACVASSCAGPTTDCYLKQTPFQCCSTIQVCREKEVRIPLCNVDGKTYKDGERFIPLGEPDKICYCGEGYEGKNVEPYCISRKPGWCGNTLYAVGKIRENCAPVYAHDRLPQFHCNRDFRCYDAATDSIKKRDGEFRMRTAEETYDSNTMCKFGNLTLRIGEIINEREKSTMRCTCEVPPVVTCRDVVAKP